MCNDHAVTLAHPYNLSRVRPDLKKNLIGLPWRVAFALQDDGVDTAVGHRVEQAEPDAGISPGQAQQRPTR